MQPLTAEVTLVIDKNQMVPVMVARTGQRAILYGYGGGVEIRYLPQSADIRTATTSSPPAWTASIRPASRSRA